MARNAEKAMTALARWRKMQLEEMRGPEERRPAIASECNDVQKALKWRHQVISEISKKISQIQNPGMGEFKIRDLNDEINKLLRIKSHWEVRIKELGGPDFRAEGPKWIDKEGREVPGAVGYKYFGAAKDLPGVRDIIESKPRPRGRKTRAELMKYIDADYYGYMDDEDGVLIPLEQAEERKAIARSLEEWKRKKESGIAASTSNKGDEEPDIYLAELSDEEEEDMGPRPEPVEVDDLGQPQYIAHVPVPSQKEVEEALVERKKTELLEKYASQSLMLQSQEARTLMGFD